MYCGIVFGQEPDLGDVWGPVLAPGRPGLVARQASSALPYQSVRSFTPGSAKK
jgi:hypothetical protein